MIKKLFSHTAIYGLAPQITKVASVLSLPLITQHLTSVDFGIYGVVTAVSGAIAVLNVLGLRVVLGNSFFKSPNHYKWAWRQIYGFLMIWNIPYSFILGLILWWFIPKEAETHRALIILLNVLPIVFFGPTSVLGTTLYQLKQKPIQVAYRSVIFGLTTVILNVYFIVVLKQGYMGWFLSTCISTMLSQASYFLPLNRKYGIKPIFNFKWKSLKKYLKVSLPTIPHYYSAYLLDSSDRAIMKALNVSTGNIGLYNAAYTVGNLFRNIGTAAGLAAGPLMNAAYKEGKEEVARNVVFTLQIVFFLLTSICSIFLKEIFVLLLKNKELQQTYSIGIVILMAYNYRPMYLGANNKLFYEEKTRLLLRVTFIAGIINVVLNLALIPLWGYKVAAFTTFLSLMYMGYAGYFTKTYKGMSKVDYYPLFWLLLTLILTVSVYLLADFNIGIRIIYALAVLFLSVFFLIKINRNDGTR